MTDEEILAKLEKEWKFIGSIVVGYKPCFNKKYLIGENEWFPTLRRRLQGETGKSGVIYIANLFDETIQFLSLDFDNKIKYLPKIKEFLTEGHFGVFNLIRTYEADGQKDIADEYSNILNEIREIVLAIDEKY